MWEYNYYPNSDELYHHGILGMKWGKRNGPPYPLGASDHSASEKKAGWRKSLDSDGKVGIVLANRKTKIASRKEQKASKKARRALSNEMTNKTIQNAEMYRSKRTKELTKKYEKAIDEYLEKQTMSDEDFSAIAEKALRSQMVDEAKYLISEYGLEKTSWYVTGGHQWTAEGSSKTLTEQEIINTWADKWWMHAI